MKQGKADGKAMATALQPVEVKGNVVEQEKRAASVSTCCKAWPVMHGHPSSGVRFALFGQPVHLSPGQRHQDQLDCFQLSSFPEITR
jgi:hypothetical protein